MARKSAKEENKVNYNAEVRVLKEQGPERLYFLWGPEDYLREQFLLTLKKRCLPEYRLRRLKLTMKAQR